MPARFRIPLAALLVLAPAAAGQERPSHLYDPDDTPPKNIGKLLDARRGNLGGFDSELLRNLIKNFPPEALPKIGDEEVKNFLRDNPQFRDPKNLERLREMVQQQMKEQPRPEDPKVDWNRLQDQLRRMDDLRKDPMLNKLDPNPMVPPLNPMVPPPPKTPPSPPPPKKADREAQDVAKWLSKAVGDSPALRDSARDIAKILGSDGKGGQVPKIFADLEKEWKAFSGSGGKGDDKSTAAKIGEFTKDIKLPDLNTGGGGGRSNPPSSPSVPSSSTSWGGSSGGSSGGGSWTPVVILVVIALGGLMFWLFYIRRKPAKEEDAAETRRDWPVDPGAVATREDVVRAFEYLSLAKCGEEAVNWHHHQIAERLGSADAGDKEAADQLAHLYEKARYAPANELFTETEIAEARARIRQLAGAPTA
jgi:hypothetical protein